MVNSKNVAFKVNKQTPFTQTIDGAYGTVINCRTSTAKSRSADKQEPPQWRSHDVPLSNVPGARKRKWHNDNDKEKGDESRTATPPVQASATPPPASTAPSSTALLNQQWVQRKPTRLRKGKHLLKGVDLDCWFNIYSFTDPAQLLDMRTKIATCFRFLRDNPMLWKHSREYNFGPDMPDPPAELTEFQFAHLRHGHGCMSCHAPNTRKTYWPFLRRWCKPCLHSKCIKAQEAYTILRGSNGDDLSWLYRAVPSGVFDSWGNFTGVGPASTHSLKTVYLASDLHELVAEYETYRPSQSPDQTPEEVKAQHDKMHKWLGAKIELAEQRRAFAKKMETWEENARSSKSYDYQARKAARKEYFKEKAQQLHPPIPPKELENCASFKRAILIPKEPNNISWLQLKPKLEREAAANLAKANSKNSTANLPSTSHGPTTSTATTSRASSHLEIQPPYLPPPNVDFTGLTLPRPRWQG